ncbi:formylglycine-generating enzyme family protein [Pedobacter arcticus]|uniref:formylglycine-generating enzyme family protein n=1 Tax=Pedobacter arcticus TaxID=752140 RepID=UPI0002FA65DB|nr:formylglycine-generating enzyme family protein [Pedobacter arcticus]
MISSFLKTILIIFISIITTISSGFSQHKAAPEGMVKIPAGKHRLFFEEKQGKTVDVQAFYLDITPVTNEDFFNFVKQNPKWVKSKVSKLYADAGYLKHWKSDFNYGSSQLKNSPVVNVSWYAANAYAKWKGKRLPNLVEWEYVGSAPILNEKRPMEEVILSWYSKPTPVSFPSVGTTLKNKFNVFDMHGLVWEWVVDFNSVVIDGDSRSNSAINRDLFCASGSFGAADKEDYAAFMRYAFRGSLKAKYTVSNLGFRCAKDVL